MAERAVRSKLTAVAAALTNILIGVCSMPTTEAAGDTGKLTKLLEVSLGQPVMQAPGQVDAPRRRCAGVFRRLLRRL